MAEVGGAAFGGGDPGADAPGRIVADVLGVAAVQVGDPVAAVVLVEGDDFTESHSLSMGRGVKGKAINLKPIILTRRSV